MGGDIDLSKAQGHEFPPIRVHWLKRDVLLFSSSIAVDPKNLHLLYELHPNFAAFPTYPLILPFKETSQEINDFIRKSLETAKKNAIPGAPEIDYSRVVDGERELEVLRPIPTSSEGRQFEIRGRSIGKAGLVLENETFLVDAQTGEEYTRMRSSGFAVGQGGYGGPKGPKDAAPVPKIPKRTPDWISKEQTFPGSALLYRLNGDYNPLHASPENGYNASIDVANLKERKWDFQEWANADPSRFVSFRARFAFPVLPGDLLEVHTWRGDIIHGMQQIFLEVKVNSKTVLSNGLARIKIDGSCKL